MECWTCWDARKQQRLAQAHRNQEPKYFTIEVLYGMYHLNIRGIYQNPMLIPQFSEIYKWYCFFLLFLPYWGHVTIIHWQSYPRMNCSDSTSPNPSSKSWIFILFLLPRIQLQHLAVAMLLASCKKRSLQHVGCLPKKSHRNLADVCSGKNKTRARRVPELCEEKHPKHHGCFGASLKHQRCFGDRF